MRYEAQVAALQEESFRATKYLTELEDGGAGRAVEAVVVAKEADLQRQLGEVLERLEESSLLLMLEQREDADNLEALH